MLEISGFYTLLHSLHLATKDFCANFAPSLRRTGKCIEPRCALAEAHTAIVLSPAENRQRPLASAL